MHVPTGNIVSGFMFHKLVLMIKVGGDRIKNEISLPVCHPVEFFFLAKQVQLLSPEIRLVLFKPTQISSLESTLFPIFAT